MPECSDIIYDLEKVNQIIDLCIDCELYDEVNDIIGLSTNAQSYIDDLYKPNGEKSLEAFGLEKFDFPVEVIRITPSIISSETIQASLLFRAKKPPYPLKNEAGIKPKPLLKNWSDLFWAKRIRAELLCHNKDTWNKRYEDLLTFLDRRIPVSKSENQTDFILTKFNYLMEQSAVATSEASYGYAERARDTLYKLYKEYDDPERGPYDRWILWNKGMAYQHMVGRNQEAVLDFNWVIRKFWLQKPEKNKEKIEKILREGCGHKRNVDIVLEYLINIVPAYLQRAAINLKLQLGYHALQTLSKGLDDLLLKIKGDSPEKLICDATDHLQRRIDLQRIEALLQLDLENDDRAKDWLKKAHDDIFNDKDWNPKVVTLPLNEEGSSHKAIKTQLVEHTLKWFEQKASRLLRILPNPQNKSKIEKSTRDENTSEEIKQSFTYLKGLIKIFWHAEQGSSSYWDWVEGNNQDELIYFSRWAQLLKLGMETVDKLRKLGGEPPDFRLNLPTSLIKPGDASACLLEDTIDLYLFLSKKKKLPVIRDERPKNHRTKTIELENLRSDDLPDFTNGLSVFYKKMSNYLLKEKAIPPAAFQNSRKGAITLTLLKDDHLQLLAALDEFHEEFGENQQIHALKRCDERLIWHRVKGKADPKGGCTNCLMEINESFSPESFDGLLLCQTFQKEIPSDKKELPPEKRNMDHNDYEFIMQDTEKHLTEHLAWHSQQPPQQTLRFIGLQRWNSLTPAQGKSVGGGYFIYRTDSDGEVDLGIAIDPGFDYVRNLFRMGFSLMDVDIVLISHAHPDHLWDFESMVQLLHELEGKTHKIHQLNVVLTLGSYHRLSHIINNPGLRRFINPLVLDIRKEIEPNFFKKLARTEEDKTPQNLLNYCFSFSQKKENEKTIGWQPVLPGSTNNGTNREIEIWPTRAYHEDYSEISDSFGFLIKVREQDSSETDDKQFCFGYTGDTKWVSKDLYNQGCPNDEPTCQEKCHKDKEAPRWKDVASQYADCDVLLMHLGSLINHKKKDEDHFKDYPNAEKCEALIRSKNHPYLMGMIRFLREIYKEPRKDKLILMGEFGEELRGGIRTDIVKRLQQGLTRDWQIVPVDVGLDILLHSYAEGDQPIGKFEFLCALCDKHRPLSEIDYFRFGQDEAIFYICKTCKKATPADVRQTRLGQLYEIGRELRTFSQKAR
ncbi:beta-lactamase superfamily domain protein [bacterium BMS3Bbin14]|nr:beta-lactamase superfamily domain protein [bacterium BMS3Bbin14]